MSAKSELNRLTKNEWDDIEQKVSPEIKSVALGMVSFGEEIIQDGDYQPKLISPHDYKISNSSNLILKSFSDKFKKIISKKLFKILTEQIPKDEKTIEHKKSKGKKGNTGQQMKENARRTTILKRIEEDLELMNETTPDRLIESNFTLTSSKLLNYLVWYFKISNSKDSLISYKLYDCLLSLSRAIEYFEKSYDGFSSDILSYCSHVVRYGISEINIQELQIKYPELITQSSFDKFSYRSNLKLYNCQKEVMIHIYHSLINEKHFLELEKSITQKKEQERIKITSEMNNLKSKIPIMINYQTPPGAGKTTLVICLARIVSEFGKQVIYVCYNDIVRKEVSKMLFHSGTTFAIVSDCHIKPHNSCFVSKKNKGRPSEHEDKSLRLNSELARIKSKCDKQPSVLVCDLTSAVLLLKTSGALKKYVAYIDEPTAGAEETDSIMTSKYMEIILNSPFISVCLSATMPKNEETPLIYDFFKNRYECLDDNIKTVISSLIPINCEVIDNQGNIVCPHNLIKSNQELSKTIQFLEDKPFLLRFYTAKTLYQLRSILDEYPEYQLEPYKPTLANLNHSHTREECLRLLKVMANLDSPKIIEKLTVRTPLSSDSNYKGFDLDTCLTSTAHTNLGQTLIINKDNHGHQLALVKSQEFLKRNNFQKLKNQFKDYDRQIIEYQKRLSTIDKNKNIKGEDETCRAKSELEYPSFNWESKLTVNSLEHLTTYSGLEPEEISTYDKFIKLCPLVQGLNIEQVKEFPDLYDTSILMGIGVIDPSSSLLSSNGNIYNEEVLKMSSQGSLSYIEADQKISYGTNLPIQKVVIYNNGQSQNTIHQQLGRVGRLGKSLSGLAVILDEEVIQLAFTSITNNIEAQNMNTAICKLLENT